MKNHLRRLVIIFVILLILSIVLGNAYYDKINPIDPQVRLGVSYSPEYASELGLDWRKTYLSIINDLQVKKIRLNSYWSEIEPYKGAFRTEQLDYLIDQADKSGIDILLVVGKKQPHWPECFVPPWARRLEVEARQQQTLKFIEKIVNRYKNRPSVKAWQVENEPVFDWGDTKICDPIDREFLKTEVDLVRQLDPGKPIVITDSGELRPWRTPMQLSDVFGTTMYRKVYNPILGYFYWPLPPAFYNLKSTLVREIFAQNNTKTIIAELQTEPWLPNHPAVADLDSQLQTFSPADLANNVTYAKRTGFDEIYLWGVEWWYFMNSKNHPEYLQIARALFN